MKTTLFINGGKVEQETPSQRFKLRLEWAIDYYRKHSETEDIIFLVSGRWGRVTDNFIKTEAEIGREIILQEIPKARVIKEDISVELIGNYAFSKPLIKALQSDKVIVITSDSLQKRVEYITKKIFADDFAYEYQFLQDEMSDNQVLLDKDAQALTLFKKLFAEVEDGDDKTFREILLYKTPYYFKGIIDDKSFFDTYWEGGFDNYLKGINTRNYK